MYKYAPYSFSKMGTWQNCSNRFKLQYVDKIKQPFVVSEALEKGKFIHYIIENYLLDNDLKELIQKYKFETVDSYKKFLPLIKEILESDRTQSYKSKDELYVEDGFGLYFDENSDCELGTYKKMGGVNPTIRGYIDLMIKDNDTVYIIDHNTGRYKEDQNQLQLMVYFLVASLKFKDVDKFIVQFDFVEHNKSLKFEYHRSQFDEIFKTVKGVIDSIEKDTVFVKGTKYCDWCPYHGEHCSGIEAKELEVGDYYF